MRIVAIVAARNEELYLGCCLRHLIADGLEVCLIDNDSTDRTRSIAEAFRGNGVIGIEDLPFHGHFDLIAQLWLKEQLIGKIDADWFIHVDADEIMHSFRDGESLRAGIERLDGQGWEV